MRRLFALATLFITAAVCADEGMWLPNKPPRQLLKQRYGFDITPQWSEHVQRSAVRFNNGGSASFVSKDGLIITNHHVGFDCIQKLSSEKNDYVKNGFLARSRAGEMKCHDLEINVLMSIEDVTARVNGAVTAGMGAAEAQAARRAVMSTIEKESLDKTGLRSDVITLYQGGEYHLYRYKKYTDVRLVMAPEEPVAFLGGDPDNFEFPRYNLDIAFFRAYENDKPANVEHFLKWSREGAKEGDLIFMAGNPGRTTRLNTVSNLEFMRDVQYPFALSTLRRREVLYNAFAHRSAENERRIHDDLRSVENSRKAYIGRVAGLQDPSTFKAKRAAEETLRTKVMNDPALRNELGDAWEMVSDAIRQYELVIHERSFLELGNAFNSRSFDLARKLVRLADESTKPNAQRLRDYRETAIESLKQDLYSEAPIYEDVEILKMADALSHWIEMEGADNLLVQQVLDGKSPQERASDLIRGTKVRDVAFRKQLGEGGKAAVDASNDPLINVARLVDSRAREVRKAYEERVEEPLRQAYAKIARAGFRTMSGAETYPDATFTLRLAFGTVKGYDEGGRTIRPFTTLRGGYDHAAAHNNEEPFNLPQSWLSKKSAVNLDTPFNFISTSDSIGGNSGSPMMNRAGEFVGIIFDGNLQSLAWDYQFSDVQGRSIAVDARGILEALRKIYGATGLVNEILQ